MHLEFSAVYSLVIAKQDEAMGELGHKKITLQFFFFFVICLFSAALTAYGGFQARGQIRAVAASLRQSRSNARSKPCLRPTPQLTATPDP